MALAWAVAARLPEQAEVVLVGPSNLVRASLDRWPSRLTVVELPGSSVDSAEQRRRGATAATGDLIRFIDVGESEGSADPHEATLEWADRLRFRNAGPP